MNILVWVKCPAVTTGGKAYFYVAHIDNPPSGRMARVVWDRRVRAYLATVDGISGTNTYGTAAAQPSLLGYFSSYRRAQKECEKWVRR